MGVKDLPYLLGRLVKEGGASPLKTIAMATGESAAVLGPEDEIGTIKVGKSAELLLVEGNPLEDKACLTKPSLVLVNGEKVAKDGRLLI